MSFGAAWMREAVASRIAEEAQDADPYHELDAYLASPLEPFESLEEVGVIKWWKDHGVVYPTLARMARDFLAVPGSSTASERQFSSARHIGTEFRNRLTPAVFEAVQILKGGYKAGMLSAYIETAALAKELECGVDEMIPKAGPDK
jgi:hypothetical protein